MKETLQGILKLKGLIFNYDDEHDLDDIRWEHCFIDQKDRHHLHKSSVYDLFLLLH